ncbi:MAG TPA: O-antigen polymerase [Longimicrobium sp.]
MRHSFGGAALAAAAPPPAPPAAPAAATPNPFVEMRSGWRLAVCVVFALYLGLVVLFALLNGTPGAELMVPALALLIAVRLWPIMSYRRERYGWFHPLVFTSLFALVGLARSFPQYAFGMLWHRALPNWSPERLGALVALELVLTALGLVAYYAGYLLVGTPRVPRLRVLAPRAIPLRAAAVGAMGAAIFAYYLSTQGGFVAHLLSWARSRHTSVAGEFYWLEAAGIGTYACLLWLSSDHRAPLQPVFWGCAALALMITFLGAGGRGAVILPMVLGLIVWMLARRRFVLTGPVLLVPLALFLISVLGEFRNSTRTGVLDWDALTSSPIEAITHAAGGEVLARATTGSAVIAILAHVPDRVDHLYGSTYLAVLSAPVPRSLWPGKPGLAGGRVGRVFFGREGGVPPGAVGEAYWNFNVPGVVLVFFLFGLFHRWLASLLVANPEHAWVRVFYVVGLFSAQPTSSGAVTYLVTLGGLAAVGVALGLLSLRRNRVRG